MNNENLENIDLNSLNQIDMDCNFVDDDESLNIKDNSNNDQTIGADDRNLQIKTGIMISFDDEDNDVIDKRDPVINTQEQQKIVDDNIDINKISDMNLIDMETNVIDDEYLDDNPLRNKASVNLFDDDINYIDSNKTLVDEKEIDVNEDVSGTIEDDYWKKIQKQHEKSNKKGSYNYNFHLAGNPELEKDMFNHIMGSDFEANASSDETPGDITGTAAASGEASVSEKLENTNNYTELFKSLLDLIGFEITKYDDLYELKDKYNYLPTTNYKSLKDMFITLDNYFYDLLILPLEMKTSNKSRDYKVWVKYIDDNKEIHPECANDLKYIDLLANHLDEVKI